MVNKIKLKGSLKPKDSLFGVPPAKAIQMGVSQHTERVTLPLSPEQKDLLDALGKKLQRQRITNEYDFNRNSILRGLIGLLDEHTFQGISVNTEQEFSDWLKEHFRS